jgi:hypothetical protein
VLVLPTQCPCFHPRAMLTSDRVWLTHQCWRSCSSFSRPRAGATASSLSSPPARCAATHTDEIVYLPPPPPFPLPSPLEALQTMVSAYPPAQGIGEANAVGVSGTDSDDSDESSILSSESDAEPNEPSESHSLPAAAAEDAAPSASAGVASASSCT